MPFLWALAGSEETTQERTYVRSGTMGELRDRLHVARRKATEES
jgi:hypothetical protein